MTYKSDLEKYLLHFHYSQVNIEGIKQKVIKNYSQPEQKANGFQLHWLNTLHQTQYEQFLGTNCWPWVVSIDHKLNSQRVYIMQAAIWGSNMTGDHLILQ